MPYAHSISSPFCCLPAVLIAAEISYWKKVFFFLSRGLREEVYRASITRASSGNGNNAPLIERILALRLEKARLLGYSNHAEVSMASKVSCQRTSVRRGGKWGGSFL